MGDTRKRLGQPRLNYSPSVVVLLAGATAFSAVVAAIIPNLGWNLLADAISLWFGLFVVDLALAKGRAEAELPAHRAMVDDLVRVRSPISQVLMLFLWEAATMADIPEMRLAARGEGDVAEILSRKALASPAPMRKLGLITGPQASWKDVIFRGLSPEALRLESLIARYITVADSPILAALQGLETSMFADVMRGRIVYADDAILRVVMWRSLIQSLAALDTELEVALTRHPDRGAALGPASYVDLAITFVEQGVA